MLYWIVYRLFGYRTHVVDRNLTASFPEKSTEELRKIRNQFYRSFFDFVIETLRCIGISNTEIRNRVVFKNPELLDAIPEEKAVLIFGSHTFNWEINGMAMSEILPRQMIFSYQQLSSAFSGKVMHQTRTKFGAEGVLRHETAKSIIARRKAFNSFYVIGDQAPVGVAQRYWTKFLNQETSFYHGMGKVSKLAELPSVVLFPRKIGRGKYEIFFEWVAQNPADYTPEEILERYIRILEREIQNNPSEWLWTHKRWKNIRREGDILSKELSADVKE